MDALVIDTFADEGPHQWAVLGPEVGVYGAVLKVSEGNYYSRDAWLADALAKLRTRFRGGFHYLDCLTSGKVQAQLHLGHARRCGLYSRPDDFAPVMDLEWELGKRNWSATKDQIETCVGDFVEEIKRQLGVAPIRYTNCGMLQAKGITGTMGCSWDWLARYTPNLPAHADKHGCGYADVSIPLEHIWLWQYAGDGEGELAGYPNRLSAFGRSDMNVAIAPSGPGTVESLARATIGAMAPHAIS